MNNWLIKLLGGFNKSEVAQQKRDHKYPKVRVVPVITGAGLKYCPQRFYEHGWQDHFSYAMEFNFPVKAPKRFNSIREAVKFIEKEYGEHKNFVEYRP